MENAHAGEVPASASWRALPLERKLHWLLRLGVVGCFIGHGVYGVLTKEAWVPYFGVIGIDRAWAYRLMPWIGGMDVSLGLLMAFVPLPVVLLHLTVWGLWTGSLRPLSGDSVWEWVERAGNYGVPLAFLLLVGVPRRLRGWFIPAWPSVMRPLTADTARVIHWILRVTTCLLLLGHGALGALNGKPTLTAHYASIGLQDIAVSGLTLTRMVGSVELVLAVAVLVAPHRPTRPAAAVRRRDRGRVPIAAVLRVCPDHLGLQGCQARSERAQLHLLACCVVACCVLERAGHDRHLTLYPLQRHLSCQGRTLGLPALERLRQTA